MRPCDCIVLESHVPSSILYEVHIAIARDPLAPHFKGALLKNTELFLLCVRAQLCTMPCLPFYLYVPVLHFVLLYARD